MIRHCQEDPWAGLDALVAAMPRTPKRAGTRLNGAVTFATTPDSLMELWVQRLIAHGVHSIWVYDVLFNMDKMLHMAHVAKEAGAVVTGAMMFTLSPVHSDEYYADKADKLSASPDVSTLLLYDTGGVLERDRLRTLIPALVARARQADRAAFQQHPRPVGKDVSRRRRARRLDPAHREPADGERPLGAIHRDHGA